MFVRSTTGDLNSVNRQKILRSFQQQPMHLDNQTMYESQRQHHLALVTQQQCNANQYNEPTVEYSVYNNSYQPAQSDDSVFVSVISQ